jgi:hypothetical protein
MEADDELAELLHFDLTCVMLETEPLVWNVSIQLQRQVTSTHDGPADGRDVPAAETTVETTVESLSTPTVTLVASDIKASSKVCMIHPTMPHALADLILG